MGKETPKSLEEFIDEYEAKVAKEVNKCLPLESSGGIVMGLLGSFKKPTTPTQSDGEGSRKLADIKQDNPKPKH